MPHTRQIDTTELVALTAAECMRLLASTPVGRLVFTEHGLPAVRPVAYLLDDDTIVFATANGSKHTAASRGDIAAFQADHFDLEHHTGWTVTAIGHLSIPTDETGQLSAALASRAWLPGLGSQPIRLAIEHLDGRRLG